jgi:RecB family endonuclease NucS
MRLIVADCEVSYRGRLTASLVRAPRLVMIKADGCVSIHADDGAYKPLNWMNAPNTRTEDDGVWTVTNPAGELLEIRLYQVWSDHEVELGDEPGLEKEGVEAELQRLLADNPSVLTEGMRLIGREYPTDVGPVDLLCRDEADQAVAVEIKRRGELAGVEQLTRYLERLNRDPLLSPVTGVFAAERIAPQARTIAEQRGITCVELDYDALLGREPDHPRLFHLSGGG